ncbi:MAG: TonB-dependent receptor [Flavobacteriaceae bacterium]|nr:TonB-dependent receptor [Flavobacteriaceae bacterium]
MKTIIVILFLFSATIIYAQTGIIKGNVIDKQSESPLPGATIELLNNNEIVGVITDIDGHFKLENVPLGRQTIRVSYIGFETITIPNIVVTSGKDAVVTVNLIETFGQLDEVILTSTTSKDRPRNEMIAVSARQFSLEEVTRYSGGRGDVGRLAANYAGVSTSDDSRNDIVIRGNSPTGLLWRLEGIPIPSPNHFSTLGTTGGPVSALNPNMLKNSDFITSAFPAEYGNALGGVFDLGFRKGNSDNYEYTLQMGAFSGIEAMAEGPLGKNDGSFLVAGRYSLIGLIGGGTGTSAIPNYSDVSFNLDFGKSKLGRFSLFGIIGTSNIDFLGDDIDEDDLFAAEDEDSFVTSGFGVVGLKHRITIGDNSYLKTIIAGSLSSNQFDQDRYIDFNTPQERKIKFNEVDNTETRFTFSTLFNTKLSSKTTFRTGLLVESFNVKSKLNTREQQFDNDGDGDPDMITFRDSDENLSIIQPYVQGQFRVTEKLTLNAGLHGQYSTLNEQFVLEPRVAVNWKIAPKHSLSLGYGLHHQPVSLPLLFLNEDINGESVQTNRNLDFVQSNHFVLGYDVKLANSWRGKAEVYYQNITNAAVEPFSSSYSSLIEGAGFGFETERVSLVSEGTGFNQGVELTLEKFFSRGYYGLLTASFFESKYEGNDGIERNTPFNNGYVLNLLTGREFKIGKAKKNVFFVDTKLTTAGGRYFTPVDLVASQQAGFQILQENIAFSEQNDPYFRWDVKFGIKFNNKTKKRSHQFYVDLQNVTNNDNIFERRYNRLTNNVDQIDQLGFFPDVGYRFQF